MTNYLNHVINEDREKREDTAAEVVGSTPTRSTVCPLSNQGHLLVRLHGLENYNATNKDNKSSVRLWRSGYILLLWHVSSKILPGIYSNNSLTSRFIP